ncbi:MAG: STAS domain-containing protein [Planctomycetes bacterium]|nr:STAS domain-containing protein [Planctomycetota bacterium]
MPSKDSEAVEKRLRPEMAYLVRQDVLVIRLSGRILQDVSESLMNFLAGRRLEADSRVVLNLAEAVYLSSSAIGALVRTASECRVKLAPLSDAARKVLELAEILPMLDIASSEEQALRDFAAGAPPAG